MSEPNLDLRPERVTLYQLELPLRQPFETSFGRTEVRSIALVRFDKEGLTAWGESVADHLPLYSSEFTEEVLLTLERIFIPLLMNRPLPHPGAWVNRASRFKGHPMAKAAVEMALWDLYGQLKEKSLKEIWGGVRDRIPVGVSIGLQPDDDALLDTIESYRSAGYQRIKLKIKPNRDLLMLQKVRRRYPDIPLMVDANAAYHWPRDQERLKTLDDFNLLMLEQPFPPDEWMGHRMLHQKMKTPLCLDESITTPATLRLAFRLRAVSIVNIKPGRVGGYVIARQLHDICQKRKVPVWCGGMLETGIGRAANAALASLPNFQYPADLSASDRYWKEDLIDPPFTLQPDSTLSVPSGPGLGVHVLESRVQRFAVRWMTLVDRTL